MTKIRVERYAGAALTGAATPLLVTTTNIPGNLVYSMAADGAAIGAVDRVVDDFPGGFATSAQNTATTIVAPATTNVIWRLTATYFVAP